MAAIELMKDVNIVDSTEHFYTRWVHEVRFFGEKQVLVIMSVYEEEFIISVLDWTFCCKLRQALDISDSCNFWSKQLYSAGLEKERADVVATYINDVLKRTTYLV